MVDATDERAGVGLAVDSIARGLAASCVAGPVRWLVREPPEPYDPDGRAAPDGTVSDPASMTPDELDELAEEITTLSAHIAAAEQRRARLVARFDAAGGWKPGGHQSCANWLSLHAGLALHTAREVVRVGRALEELPESSAAMARGALSFDQARALTRVASPATESDLLELAENSAPSTFRRTCRAWKRESREDEAERERRRHDERYFRMFPNGDGMYRLDALVTPKSAANTQILIDDNYLELYGKDRRAAGGAPLIETPRERARRRADAFGLGIERALAGLRGGMGAAPRRDPDADDYDPAADRTLSGLRAARTRVLVHVDLETLKSGTEPGLSELADGTRLSAETARRIACDCSKVEVTRDSSDGRIVDVGRASRTIPTAIRRALQVRDRGCRFPGCANRFTDGHHVVHWVDGGPTSLANTMLLCGFHHRLVHEGGWTVQWWGREKTPVFLDPGGGRHAGFRPRRRGPPSTNGAGDLDAGDAEADDAMIADDPVAALMRQNHANGAEPNALTAAALWRRQRDVPEPVLFRALEAVAPEPTEPEPTAPG